MKILAHRGNINGKFSVDENSFYALNSAVNSGFNVEFDINFNPDKTGLVLSHDERKTDKKYDVYDFLSSINNGFHGLNVKNIFTLPAIMSLLQKLNNKENFFLFDFELLINDIKESMFFMRSLIEEQFNIAFRLSEREDYFKDYLNCGFVNYIWLDEFEEYWVTEKHIKQLKDKNKVLLYVSPELHKELPVEKLKHRWEEISNWGVDAICTDYPVLLNKILAGPQ